MARYSSDTDSDHNSRYRRKHYRRSRSSSTDSSDSSSHRKRSSRHSKTKRKHRSRSRSRGKERNSRRYKSSRSHSRDRDKYRHRTRRSKSHSAERSKKRNRSISREQSRSRSSSSQSNIKPFVSDKPQNIIQRDEFQIEPCFKEGVLEEINADNFIPKEFSSSSHTKGNKFKNIVIDVSADTIQVPPIQNTSSSPESIFHSSIMLDQEARFDKWVKKLYSLRQKAVVDLSHSSII